MSCSGVSLTCTGKMLAGCDGATIVEKTCGSSEVCDVASKGCLAATALYAGQHHACALMQDESAYCWGAGKAGQLGQAAVPTDFAKPGLVVDDTGKPLRGVKELALGELHTCAVVQAAGSTVRKVFCWGEGFNGRLGTNSTTDVPVPTLAKPVILPENVALPTMTENRANPVLSASGEMSCAVVATSPPSAYCWGRNAAGALGVGSLNANENLPLPVGVTSTPLQGVSTIAVAGYHSCSIAGTPAQPRARCAGAQHKGQLGDNQIKMSFERSPAPPVLRADGNNALMLNASAAIFAAGGFVSPDVNATWGTTCAVSGGNLFCWGYNGMGQIGDGKLIDLPVAFPHPKLSGGGTVSKATLSPDHTCALTTTGAVHCWGSNESGQLDAPATTNRTLTPQVLSGGPYLDVAAAGEIQKVNTTLFGVGYTCLLTDNATHDIRCVGSNADRILGTASAAQTEAIVVLP